MAVTPALAPPTVAPRKGGDAQTPGPAPVAKGAAANPKFQTTVARVRGTAKALRAHPSAEQKRDEADAAKKHPAGTPAAEGEISKLAKVAATPEAPMKQDFASKLEAAIKPVIPRSYAEAKARAAATMASQLTAAASAPLAQDVRGAKEGLERANKTEAPPIGAVPASTPLPPPQGARAPAPDTRGAAPAPRPPPVTRQGATQKADTKIKDAGLEPDHLKRINHPRTNRVLSTRDKAIDQATRAEAKHRTDAVTRTASTEASLATSAAQATAAMTQSSATGAGAVHAAQGTGAAQATNRLETKIAKIEQICTRAEDQIETILSDLETNAENKLRAAIETETTQLKTDAEAAFSGLLNKLARVVDKVVNHGEATRETEDQLYQGFKSRLMTQVLHIADEVDAQLRKARKVITDAQVEIQGEVNNSTNDEKKALADTLKDVSKRFKDLEHNIDNKENELVQKMSKAVEQAMLDAARAIEEVSKNADKLFDGLTSAILDAVRFIEDLANRLKAALRKGADAVKMILKDPVGFLANLLNAVKGGVMNFVTNFKHWLMQGLAGWLFGELADGGIELPSDLSLKSLFKLAMSVLGLTWANIRARMARVIGEPAMAALEAAGELIKLGLSGDVGALWEHVKGDLGGIEAAIIDAIISFVAERIIVTAAQKLVTMTNPAGAVVEAVMTIARFIGFLIERAGQIMSFVESVVGSVHAIASGAIGDAVARIEQSLGKAVPLVISLFASMVGLGGISRRIIGIIRKVQGMINNAIDRVIKAVVAPLAKRLAPVARKMKGAVKRAGARIERGVKAIFGPADTRSGAKTGSKGDKKQADAKAEAVRRGLNDLRRRDQAARKRGGMTRARAGAVAAAVQASHKVFRRVEVHKVGGRWDYVALASRHDVSGSPEEVSSIKLPQKNPERPDWTDALRSAVHARLKQQVQQIKADPGRAHLAYAAGLTNKMPPLDTMSPEHRAQAKAVMQKLSEWSRQGGGVVRASFNEIRQVGDQWIVEVAQRPDLVFAIRHRIADQTLRGYVVGSTDARPLSVAARTLNSKGHPVGPEDQVDNDKLIGGAKSWYKSEYLKAENYWIGPQRSNASRGKSYDEDPWASPEDQKRQQQAYMEMQRIIAEHKMIREKIGANPGKMSERQFNAVQASVRKEMETSFNGRKKEIDEEIKRSQKGHWYGKEGPGFRS